MGIWHSLPGLPISERLRLSAHRLPPGVEDVLVIGEGVRIAAERTLASAGTDDVAAAHVSTGCMSTACDSAAGSGIVRGAADVGLVHAVDRIGLAFGAGLRRSVGRYLVLGIGRTPFGQPPWWLHAVIHAVLLGGFCNEVIGQPYRARRYG
jgi:hypothetical protein